MGQAYDENMNPLGEPEFGETEKEVMDKLREKHREHMQHSLIGKFQELQDEAREREIAESEEDASAAEKMLADLQKQIEDEATEHEGE